MESNASDWLDRAESILDQLLKFTSQLAEIEQDPGVDVKALSLACTRRLDDLRRLIPEDLRSLHSSKNEVLEKMHELYSQTHLCLEILGKKSSRAAAKLQGLTKMRKAISAYNGNGCCKS